MLERIDPDRDLLVYSEGKLVQARRTGKVSPAQEAVLEIALDLFRATQKETILDVHNNTCA